jgi:hypothetical protein
MNRSISGGESEQGKCLHGKILMNGCTKLSGRPKFKKRMVSTGSFEGFITGLVG